MTYSLCRGRLLSLWGSLCLGGLWLCGLGSLSLGSSLGLGSLSSSGLLGGGSSLLWLGSGSLLLLLLGLGSSRLWLLLSQLGSAGGSCYTLDAVSPKGETWHVPFG